MSAPAALRRAAMRRGRFATPLGPRSTRSGWLASLGRRGRYLLRCRRPVARYGASRVLPPLMLVATLVCTAPFYFAGAVLAQVLATPGLPTGRLYAADLCGAAAGCLVVLGALEILDVPSLIVLCAAAGAAAGLLFAPRDRRALALAVGLAALALWNGTRE